MSFPDEATAVAAVGRLVHRAAILEMNAESYRRREALEAKKRGHSQRHARRRKSPCN